ncbi:MAG: type II toxin-antitoxin system RelE/ParE family toxin [Candidatus Micrarchaeota archaeon]|nr:type II toxin-antitoxin system RelE/ParE family toxin [Candidatus Micrarchaeota archaeon]
MGAPYYLKARNHVDKLFAKMGKREGRNLEIIYKKLEEVCQDPKKFKPLGAPMQNLRRVHVLKSFVIIYSVDEPSHTVWIEDYAHHDEVYG